jgi:crossover junction endodeoxyribonuclease RuvC
MPEAVPMPKTERDFSDMMRVIRAHARPVETGCGEPAKMRAFLEKVHAMPKQGVTSCFTFGQNYGFIRGLLTALEIPFEDVTPNAWQKQAGLLRRNKDETITQKKNRHKQQAQQLFPHLKVTHAIADALLICEYGRKRR